MRECMRERNDMCMLRLRISESIELQSQLHFLALKDKKWISMSSECKVFYFSVIKKNFMGKN